jgi:hypothetical protein
MGAPRSDHRAEFVRHTSGYVHRLLLELNGGELEGLPRPSASGLGRREHM